MEQLGVLAKKARRNRDWPLSAVCDGVEELGVKLDPSALKKLEDGTRPGDPRVWGAIWQLLRLPLAELYLGLGLPLPTSEPVGVVAELLAMVRGMSEDAQRMVLLFAQHAPAYAAVAQGPLPLHRGIDTNVPMSSQSGISNEVMPDGRPIIVGHTGQYGSSPDVADKVG